MSHLAVRLEEVSLRYRLAQHRVRSVKEYASRWLRGALAYQDLWALTGVSFEVAKGESIGIVGRNGAGKSSLLRVVSGVLKPTRGRCLIAGRVAPILELGTGFDRELTGYENIFLNALLLGRTRREIRQRLEAIIDFSELGELIHSPVRNYSSGMLARLGFSIATAWQPEVLILDEVFAVGDAAFALKSRARMAELMNSGATCLVVSHSPEFLLRTCSRCLWLERGRLNAVGSARDVVAQYLEATAPGAREALTADRELLLPQR